MELDLSDAAPLSSKMMPFHQSQEEDLPLRSSDSQIPSLTESTINLVNTILGTGIVSIPFAFATVGVGSATVLLGLAAACTWFSLHLLVTCAEIAFANRVPARLSVFTPIGEPTYSSLAGASMGRNGAALADLALAFSCFGFATSYLVSIGQIVPNVIMGYLVQDTYLPNWIIAIISSRLLWMLVGVIAMVPITFSDRIQDYWWYNGLTFLCPCYLALLVIYQGIFLLPKIPIPPAKPWFLFQMKGFETLGIFVFAFTAHQNLFASYEAMGATYKGAPLDPFVVNRIRKTIDQSMAIVTASYTIIGIIGAISYGELTSVVILDNCN